MALIEYEAAWAPEPMWMFWRQENSHASHPHFEFNPWLSSQKCNEVWEEFKDFKLQYNLRSHKWKGIFK